MNDREIFEGTLAAFGEATGFKLALDEAGTCAFAVDGEVDVNVRYLETSDTVVLWATALFLPPDRFAGFRAARLLKWNDFGMRTRGFTFGADAETRRLVAADRRPAALFDAPGVFATWVDDLVETVHEVRAEIIRDYPLETEDLEDDGTEEEA